MTKLPFIAIGTLAGMVGSCVPWGNPTRFYGAGMPIPTVCFEVRPDRIIDYPNPVAYLINPLIGLGAGIATFLLARYIIRKLKTKEPNHAT